ncbi:PREDICTED: pentatricopeptide repeat-containing protein At4g02750-like [Nicotiana attenuata]|uniref:pentatricopeptide repeat-containing protein At4g02750-like n=1 Tax=Nicotiana attenuata TaxID=49451 RepID=UPI0009058511|nr:PREDICTED: pentatricopeptide repeat-containing protein At4g02750-like [Nicotiana attenuata]
MEWYFQNGNVEKAACLYNEMPPRDLFLYNTMISGLMQARNVEGAKVNFESMEHRDVVTWNSMIPAGNAPNRFLDEALEVLAAMRIKDVSWNLIIVGLLPYCDATARNATIFGPGKNEHGEDAIKLFIGMKEEGALLDEATFTSIVTSTCNLGVGTWTPVLEFSNVLNRDVISWNSVICGLAFHGHSKRAFEKLVV